MSLLSILETMLIGPLKLVFEIIFVIANRLTGNEGLAIIMLSLAMNILVLPLYRRADAMQEEARDVEARLQDGVAHIKKTFSGDERMMILQTYYRQNNYRPTDALNGSVSLLLEVPFFMAAYQFLSGLQLLTGVSFGPIADLGAPDGMLVIGGMAVNVLPVLMTLINVISSAIYLKGFPLKTKIQLYGMAAFFLVFLYGSPAGLVFYWTLNNVFSLGKTIFYKWKHSKKAGTILLSLAGIGVAVYALAFYDAPSLKYTAVLLLAAMTLQIPMVLPIILSRIPVPARKTDAPEPKLFLLGGVFLTVLVGMLIPSTLIAASPQEFIDPSYFRHPLLYVLSSTCLAAGTFLVWLRVFYWLSSSRGKAVFDKVVWLLCGVMLVNYMFFGTDLGIISPTLKYENGVDFSGRQELMNLAVLAAVSLALLLTASRWKRQIRAVLLTAIVALGGMSVWNMMIISRSADAVSLTGSQDEKPYFRLSKDGKNVVVLMLDRASAQLVPFIFNERPELKEQFVGFTFYDNTISFGGCTNFAFPALMGGYEYTPLEMNRSELSVPEKHNEALKVMPVLFDENGYEVTVCDPCYANYQWIPDLSIYEEYPDIRTYLTQGAFSDDLIKQKEIDANDRNFFCFGIMKCAPLLLQKTIYSEGEYNSSVSSVQVQHSLAVAEGLNGTFMDAYAVLDNLPNMTQVTESGENTFLFLINDAPHEEMLLQTPDYIPLEQVDNTAYEQTHADRFTLGDRTITVEKLQQMRLYHTSMATYIQVGEWLDHLREAGVYDNTRIILAADHGFWNEMEEVLMHKGPGGGRDVAAYYPMLMVKDFGSTEFTVSHEFMTNADVPVLATDGLIAEPRNPFTGTLLTSEEKTAHEQFIIRSSIFDIMENNGDTFQPSAWASVKDDLWNRDNWTFYDEKAVIPEQANAS